jgi:hypothetical protein
MEQRTAIVAWNKRYSARFRPLASKHFGEGRAFRAKCRNDAEYRLFRRPLVRLLPFIVRGAERRQSERSTTILWPLASFELLIDPVNEPRQLGETGNRVVGARAGEFAGGAIEMRGAIGVRQRLPFG